jgi:hypothetical protein
MAWFAHPRQAQQQLIDWWLLPPYIALYPSLIAMVFSGQRRFHFPVMPLIAMTCGWLLADWIGRNCDDARLT